MKSSILSNFPKHIVKSIIRSFFLLILSFCNSVFAQSTLSLIIDNSFEFRVDGTADHYKKYVNRDGWLLESEERQNIEFSLYPEYDCDGNLVSYHIRPGIGPYPYINSSEFAISGDFNSSNDERHTLRNCVDDITLIADFNGCYYQKAGATTAFTKQRFIIYRLPQSPDELGSCPEKFRINLYVKDVMYDFILENRNQMTIDRHRHFQMILNEKFCLRIPLILINNQYYISGTLGSKATDFLFDTGASICTLPISLKNVYTSQGGVILTNRSTVIVDANGNTAEMPIYVADVKIGEHTFPSVEFVFTSGTPLIGMNLISRLKNWTISDNSSGSFLKFDLN